jgi:hypothetical protein
MKYARTACSFIDHVEPIRITAPPGSSFSPEAGAPFLPAPGQRTHLSLRRAGRSSQLKKMCASWGISSREGESSVRGSARQIRNGRSCATAILICLSARGAMIDAPPAGSFNPNKEIGFDSP